MQLKIVKRSSSGNNKDKDKNKDALSSQRVLFVVDVSNDASVDDLKDAIAKEGKKLHPNRQRLTVGESKEVLESGTGLTKYNINDGDMVFLKDLGPQIGWQTVFYIEYLGPMVFHYLIYSFPSMFYGRSFEHSEIQR
ncbi:3-oxo-5a-steroid 4- dehydrogenase, partial [Coemansia sp. RSA 1933]